MTDMDCRMETGSSEEVDACGCQAESPHPYAMHVTYKGAAFAGFARQKETQIITVQGELERTLALLFHREVPTVCAGRTDAGVHARGQVVSFELTDAEFASRGERSLQRSVNALVHDDISVSSIERMPDGFSARFSAVCREYHYHICTDSARPVLLADLVWHIPGVHLDIPAMNEAAANLIGEHDFKSFCMAVSAQGKPTVLLADLVWHIPGVHLDIPAMNEAAANLIGEHDFKSFCMAVSAQGKPTCRNVMELEVYPETIMGTDVITVRVVGNAFLHSMVRTIVGTLVEVGRGRREPAWTAEVLAARDRCAAGQNAPANGLVFWGVSYGNF